MGVEAYPVEENRIAGIIELLDQTVVLLRRNVQGCTMYTVLDAKHYVNSFHDQTMKDGSLMLVFNNCDALVSYIKRRTEYVVPALDWGVSIETDNPRFRNIRLLMLPLQSQLASHDLSLRIG